MSEEDNNQEKTPEQREQELIEKIANLEQDKENLVGELTGERSKKQEVASKLEEAQKELDNLRETPNPSEGQEDPEEVVKKVLSQREQEEAKRAKEQALADFKSTYKEFSEDQDAGGILFKKFESELGKFNLDGLKTKEDYLNRFKEVYDFMNRKQPQPESKNYYSGTPQSGSSDAPTTDSVTLNDKEQKLMKDLGIDKERYLKIKEKRPAYVASLLKYRD